MITAIPDLLKLIKKVTLSPRLAFQEISAEKSAATVYFLFAITALYIILKVQLFGAHDYGAIDLYNNSFLNTLLGMLANPWIYIAVSYLSYFLVACLIVWFVRFMNAQVDIKKLFLSFLSVSALGLPAQLLYAVFHYSSLGRYMSLVSVIVHLWNWVLIYLAVRTVASLTATKAAILLAISFAIVFVSPLGPWSFMSPYLIIIGGR